MIVQTKNLIVVSDLHLGHEMANPKVFTEFLSWVSSLRKEPVIYHFSGNFSKQIAFPEKLILLGDIFELYDPRNGDSMAIARDAIPILKHLSRMLCEKVFVTGNHDDSMDVVDGLEIEKSMVKAYRRHYPPDPFSDSVRVGESEYFFLHGHQFDRSIKQLGKWGVQGPYIIFQLQGISRAIFGFDGWGSVILSLFLGMLYAFNTDSYFGDVFLYSLLAMSPFWASQLIWRIVAPIVRWRVKPLKLEIDTILKKKYYRPEKDLIKSDFVIFGHTHCPDMYDESEVIALLEKEHRRPKEWKPKGLVNTGGWFIEQKAVYFTFVYVDAFHIVLLKWNPQEERPELVYERSYIEINAKKKE